MRIPKVQNMTSPRSGNPVANQYIINDGEFEYFQSYETIIAKKPIKTPWLISLDKDYWDYSVTTTKYRNQFLRENTAATRAKIKSGEYFLTDLNK